MFWSCSSRLQGSRSRRRKWANTWWAWRRTGNMSRTVPLRSWWVSRRSETPARWRFMVRGWWRDTPSRWRSSSLTPGTQVRDNTTLGHIHNNTTKQSLDLSVHLLAVLELLIVLYDLPQHMLMLKFTFFGAPLRTFCPFFLKCWDYHFSL